MPSMGGPNIQGGSVISVGADTPLHSMYNHLKFQC